MPSQFANSALIMRKKLKFWKQFTLGVKKTEFDADFESVGKGAEKKKGNNEKLKENGIFVYYCVKKFYSDNFLGEFSASFDAHIELLPKIFVPIIRTRTFCNFKTKFARNC